MHALLLLMAIALVAVAIWQWRSGQRAIAVVAVVIAALAVLWYLDTDEVPEELVGTTPYVVTILVLALASQRLRMPKADGKVYRRGED